MLIIPIIFINSIRGITKPLQTPVVVKKFFLYFYIFVTGVILDFNKVCFLSSNQNQASRSLFTDTVSYDLRTTFLPTPSPTHSLQIFLFSVGKNRDKPIRPHSALSEGF